MYEKDIHIIIIIKDQISSNSQSSLENLNQIKGGVTSDTQDSFLNPNSL